MERSDRQAVRRIGDERKKMRKKGDPSEETGRRKKGRKRSVDGITDQESWNEGKIRYGERRIGKARLAERGVRRAEKNRKPDGPGEWKLRGESMWQLETHK